MGDVVLLGVMWKARLIGAGLSTFYQFLTYTNFSCFESE